MAAFDLQMISGFLLIAANPSSSAMFAIVPGRVSSEKTATVKPVALIKPMMRFEVVLPAGRTGCVGGGIASGLQQAHDRRVHGGIDVRRFADLPHNERVLGKKGRRGPVHHVIRQR